MFRSLSLRQRTLISLQRQLCTRRSFQSTIVSAEDEWSPLKSVIVGRAESSSFPSESDRMITKTMPSQHRANFKSFNPFPPAILARAQEELDRFADLLTGMGIRVYRPERVDWLEVGGYTGAMPRDGLMTVGSTIIEAPFAWRCRRREIQLAYSSILDELSKRCDSLTICRAPTILDHDALYDDEGELATTAINCNDRHWSINNSRPAFDAADFMRFGKTIVGQMSHVTNRKGVKLLQALVPDGYTVEIVNTTDVSAMHIDCTLLPLRKGLMVYHPSRISEEELRRHKVFRDWKLHVYPFSPQANKDSDPPMYMCTSWLMLNALSLDEKRIVVEASQTQFASWLEKEFGMEPIMLPFKHVNSIGGSFHCATVDLVRETPVI
jgi:glycine amidinotransferase